MKYLFLAIVFYSSFCNGQEKRNFSNYTFSLINNNTLSQGSFFLLSNSDKIYLITAAHVISGWSGFKIKTTENVPDTIFFRFYTKDGHNSFF